MKKAHKILSIGIFSASLMLAGCSSNQSAPATQPVQPQSTPSTPTKPVSSTPVPVQTTPSIVNPYSDVKVSDTVFNGAAPSGDKLDIKYPQISGLSDTPVQDKINTLLKEHSIPKNFDSDDDYNVRYEVKYQKGSLLNIVIEESQFYHGAAHPEGAKDSLVINLQNGNVYSLADLFAQNAYDKLTNIVKNEDVTHVLDSFNAFPGVKPSDSFYVTDGGVVIFYQEDEYTAHAVGFPEYRISYQDVQDLLNKNGEFWKSIPSDSTIPTQADTDYKNFLKAEKLIVSKGYVLNSGNLPSSVTSDGHGDKLFVYDASKINTSNDSSLEFFFDGIIYLGTDTANPHVASTSRPAGDGKITVTYYFNSGNSDITYSWDGIKLTPDKDYNQLQHQ